MAGEGSLRLSEVWNCLESLGGTDEARMGWLRYVNIKRDLRGWERLREVGRCLERLQEVVRG